MRTAALRRDVLGIVTGLAAEARIALSLGWVEVGGGTPAGAEAAAERVVGRGATRLMSFGLAGGLDRGLRPGDVVVAADVLENGLRYSTSAMPGLDPGIDSHARPWYGQHYPTVIATDEIVWSSETKSLLHRTTGACAVDLESGAVARVAARHDMPFAVLRAICDPAERTLPPAALLALNQRGAIGLTRLLASVARDPSQLASLLALARDAARARAALVRHVRQIGARGGLVA